MNPHVYPQPKPMVVPFESFNPRLDAEVLYKAMEGFGTGEKTIIQLLTRRTNQQRLKIAFEFKTLYGKANRAAVFTIDYESARNDAKALLEAGELRIGTDESEFIRVLCTCSWAQLAAVFQEYENIKGHDFEKAILNEFSGDIKDGLLAIVKVVKDRSAFFAERLYKSMKGMGTKDSQLIRIMVTRAEVDLGDIQEAFNQQYGESLQSWIEGDCSGVYRNCLLSLLRLY